jgi:hypothetical protein
VKMPTPRSLIISAVVIIIALSPSVSECLSDHQQEAPHRWLQWGWVALVVIIALLGGEAIMGRV